MPPLGKKAIVSEKFDSGGMFSAEVGIYKEGARYCPYVMGSFGAGKFCTRKTYEEALAEIPRLVQDCLGVDYEPNFPKEL